MMDGVGWGEIDWRASTAAVQGRASQGCMEIILLLYHVSEREKERKKNRDEKRQLDGWMSRMSSLLLLLLQCTDFGFKCPCGNGMLLRHPGLCVCPLAAPLLLLLYCNPYWGR